MILQTPHTPGLGIEAWDRVFSWGIKFMEPSYSRRRFLQKASATALLAGSSPAFLTRRAKAQAKTLRILRWKHFVPSYDSWFNEVYVKEWGEKNDTEVIVDNVGLGDVGSQAAAWPP